MTTDSTMWDLAGTTLLALTPLERWAAARRMNAGSGSQPGFLSQYGLVLAVALALLILVVLLWWATRMRATKTQSKGRRRKPSAKSVSQTELSARQRQLLQAIVTRSGLRRARDIFTRADAFERGAAMLLAESMRTQTAETNDQLRDEVTYLRKTLGFRRPQAPDRPATSRRPSSRDILVGESIQLTGRRDLDGTPIAAKVVRNDHHELVVALPTSVKAESGDGWRVQYRCGMSVWEFDTLTVRCDGNRLVLSHSERVRFVNRRRFPRVTAHALARVAHFPLVNRTSTSVPERSNEATRSEWSSGELEFVQGVVTELAGPGLLISAPLDVQIGDRVLVMFELAASAPPTDGESDAAAHWHVVEHIGQVRHCRNADDEMLFAVELTGLSDTEIEDVVHVTGAALSRTDARSPAANPQVIQGAQRA